MPEVKVAVPRVVGLEVRRQAGRVEAVRPRVVPPGAVAAYLLAADAQVQHPVRQAAEAVVAFYLGIEMITQIDSELARPDSFFDAAQQAAVFFDAFRRS